MISTHTPSGAGPVRVPRQGEERTMSATQPPGEAEARVFVDKMIAFRASLLKHEQVMLDHLVDAGLRADAADEVQSYWVSAFGARSNVDVWAPYRNTATYTGMQAGYP